MNTLDSVSVLVIDDDELIRAVIRRLVEGAGGTAIEGPTAEEGLRALYSSRPEVIVLDIDLPGLDGWQALERIRLMSDVPVVMLSGRVDELEKVRALQAGADDYVTKPFGAQELLARLHALVRRAASREPRGDDATRPYRDDAVEVDFAHSEATVNGHALEVTRREFRLLAAFVRHPRRTLSAEQLLELAWDDPVGDTRRVKVYVGYLRAKLTAAGLDPPPIETVRGFGYRYQPPDAPRPA